MKEMEEMSCEEQPFTPGLYSLERRRLKGDLSALYSFLRKGSEEGGANLFSLGSSNRTSGNGSSCAKGGIDWTAGTSSLPRGWSNTARGFLLSVFKRGLDSALNNML